MPSPDEHKAPILKRTELKEENLQNNPSVNAAAIKEAIDIENSVHFLQYLREEMLSLFDIVSENLDYPGLMKSGLMSPEKTVLPQDKMLALNNEYHEYERMIGDSTAMLADLDPENRQQTIDEEVDKYIQLGLDPAAINAFFNDPSIYEHAREVEIAKDQKTGEPVKKRFIHTTRKGVNYSSSPLVGLYSIPVKESIRHKIAGDLNKAMKAQGVEEKDAKQVITRFKIVNHAADAPSKIMFEDFLSLLQETDNRDDLTLLLYQNLLKKFKEDFNRKDKNLGEIEATEMAQTKAESLIGYYDLLMEKIIELREIEQYQLHEEGGEEKLKLYRRTFSEDVKKAMKELAGVSKGVKGAKMSKNITGLLTAPQAEQRLQLKTGKVAQSRERVARILKKQHGETHPHNPEVRETYDQLGNLVDNDFLTAYVNYHKELQKMYRLLNEGRVVETAYVKSIIEQAMPALTKDPPGIVYLHGDFGTGKTAIAAHIARTRFNDKQPLIVSGSKFLEPDRFTEEFKISQREPTAFFNDVLKEYGSARQLDSNMDKVDFISVIVGEKQKIINEIINNRLKDRTEISELPPEEKEEIKKMVDDAFSNKVEGRYVLGAMYQAMKEGRPLIIDEANAITPEVLIAFNDLMTKKVGEKFSVRTAEKQIEVKKGFCIIWTGNTGARYRQARYNDLDPAAYSRITPIKVQYLPQSKEISSIETLAERLDLKRLSSTFVDENGQLEGSRIATLKDAKALAKNDQIFQVLLAKVLNRRLGSWLLVKKDDPDSFFKDLYRLSISARTVMDIFEGTISSFPADANLRRLIGSDDLETIKSKLQKTNLTMRGLIDKILGYYLEEGAAMDLEFYIFRFVKDLAQVPEEMAIIYTIFQHVGFFNINAGWPDLSDSKAMPDLTRFADKMNTFDPLAKNAQGDRNVKKYEKVEINGDYATLLSTDQGQPQHEMRYFSSLETLQLMFGYLPPRKLPEYQKLAVAQEKATGPKLDTEKREELLRKLRQIRAFDASTLSTIYDADPKLKEMSEDEESTYRIDVISATIGAFTQKIVDLRVNDRDYLRDMKVNELLDLIASFCDIIIETLKQANVITSQEAAQIASASPEEKVDMTTALIEKLKNK